MWDGMFISLYELESSSPVLMWAHQCSGGVRALHWSPARPALFFALDQTRTVHVFDLLQSTQVCLALHCSSFPSSFVVSIQQRSSVLCRVLASMNEWIGANCELSVARSL